MLLYIFLLLVAIAFYLVVFKPLYPLIRIKMQLGDKAVIKFLPFFGIHSILRKIRDPQDHYKLFKDMVQRNPDMKIFASNYGNTPYIQFFDQQDFKQIAIDHHKYDRYDGSTDKYNHIINRSRLLSQGMLFTSGQQWKLQRQLLGQSFAFNELKQRVPLVNELYREHKQGLVLDKPINALRFASSITGDVIVRSFFGQPLPQLNGKKAQLELASIMSQHGYLLRYDFYHLYKWMLLGQNSWFIFPNKAEKEVYRRGTDLINLAKEAIDLRVADRKQQIKEGKLLDHRDFLDIHVEDLLSSKPSMTKEQIVQQFITFFLAGTDTTSTLIATSLYYLGILPETQQELREEGKSILENRSQVVFEDISKFTKLNAFLMEVLRLRTPAATVILRQVNQDHFIGDVKVKKGWIVNYNFQVGNVNPNEYERPNEFDPKRFINPKQDSGFKFTPFSAGGRNCIGQHLALIEAKVVLSLMLQEFNITVTNPNVKWVASFLYQYSPEDIIKLTPL